MAFTLYGKLIKFKVGSKAHKAELLLNPDPCTGISRTVSVDELEANNLGFGNGGDWIRVGQTFSKKYIIAKMYGQGRGNKIIALKTEGFESVPVDERERSSIPEEIRKELRGKSCVVLGYGAAGRTEVDHKNGRTCGGTHLEDFQPLSKAANNVKRQYCKECRETGKRYDARNSGYKVGWILGSSIYTQDIKCNGCYWHDPLFFNKEISKNFKGVN